MNSTEKRPKVGVGVMVFKDGNILLGRRLSSHGKNTWAFPGGHLEWMESFEKCAKRETLEECGMKIKNIRFQFLTNMTVYAPKHYVHIGMIADWKSGSPKVLEPEKCGEWGWFDLKNLPEPLFETCKLAVKSYTTGAKYF